MSLAIPEGSLVAILGPNGSGKSTLLQLLAGVLHADHGCVEIAGLPIGDPRVRRMIAYLPQEDPLYPHLTGRENIRVLAWMRGSRVNWGTVEALSKELGLSDYLDQRVGKYSGGMQRKLSILAVIAQEPRVAILDEPTSGLDPVSRRKVLRIPTRLGG